LNGENTSDFFTTQPSVKIHLDERGCLVITADYLGNEPIITNDLVEILSPTAFRWLGRIDHVINSGGIKVTPEKVEKVFEKIFYEKEIRNRFFVSNVSDQKLGQQIVLVVESASFEKTIQHEVLQAATHALHKYEIPRQILFTDSFAETATGKINRNETMKRFS
jgi:O-succinylbenzoic acid--CoA ligase